MRTEFSVILRPDQYERLETWRCILHSPTDKWHKADFIRLAFDLLDDVLTTQAHGLGRAVIVRPDGSQRELLETLPTANQTRTTP